jgi:cell division septal protein FtsQ
MAKSQAPKEKRQSLRSGRSKTLNTVFGLLPFLFSFGALGLLIGGSLAFAEQSQLFVIRDVGVFDLTARRVLAVQNPFQFAGIRPNINQTAVDLQEIERHIRRFHPEFQDVRVRRKLPNRIDIFLRRRLAAARLLLDKLYWIDTTGVILAVSTEPDARSPIITGLSSGKGKGMGGVAVGSQVRSNLLSVAIRVAAIIDTRNILKNHDLTQIDISDSKNLILRVDQDIEVRLGSMEERMVSKLSEKLDRLAAYVETKPEDMSPLKIRYIDLRFDDIVVGPR